MHGVVAWRGRRRLRARMMPCRTGSRLLGHRRCAGLGCLQGMVWRDVLQKLTCPHACAPATAPSSIRSPPASPCSPPPSNQGMNFLVGLLLTYLPTEAEAYCALSLLMRGRGLREMFLPDMSVLQIRLWQLSKLLPPRLAAHLEAHAVLPVLYVSGLVCRGSAGGCGRTQGKLRRLGGRRPLSTAKSLYGRHVQPWCMPRSRRPTGTAAAACPAGLGVADHVLRLRLPVPLCGTRHGHTADRPPGGIAHSQGARVLEQRPCVGLARLQPAPALSASLGYCRALLAALALPCCPCPSRADSRHDCSKVRAGSDEDG